MDLMNLTGVLLWYVLFIPLAYERRFVPSTSGPRGDRRHGRPRLHDNSLTRRRG